MRIAIPAHAEPSHDLLMSMFRCAQWDLLSSKWASGCNPESMDPKENCFPVDTLVVSRLWGPRWRGLWRGPTMDVEEKLNPPLHEVVIKPEG